MLHGRRCVVLIIVWKGGYLICWLLFDHAFLITCVVFWIWTLISTSTRFHGNGRLINITAADVMRNIRLIICHTYGFGSLLCTMLQFWKVRRHVMLPVLRIIFELFIAIRNIAIRMYCSRLSLNTTHLVTLIVENSLLNEQNFTFILVFLIFWSTWYFHLRHLWRIIVSCSTWYCHPNQIRQACLLIDIWVLVGIEVFYGALSWIFRTLLTMDTIVIHHV